MVDIILNKISGHAKQGKVCKIHIKSGDNVKVGDKLISIESNKGSVDFKSNINGTIKDICINEGDTLKIGDVIAKAEALGGSEEASISLDEKNENKSKSQGAFNYLGGLLKPKKEEIECDIAILGAGPGGYVAAIEAAKLGAKVVIIEKDSLGGTCLNYGCIPTKSLARSSEIFNNMKNAEAFGLEASNINVNMKKVIDRKDSVVEELKNGIEYILGKREVRIVKGEGNFLDKNTIFVKGNNTETTIKTKNVIIATGSKANLLPIKGNDLPGVITNKEALSLKEIPKKLLIIGGGIIGMEFAFIYAKLGSKVTVVEYFDSILSTYDEDIIEVIEESARSYGINLYTGAKAEEIIKAEEDNLILAFEKAGEKKFITADKILMSVGRSPVMNKEELKNIGVNLTERDRAIEVNDKMETSVEGIYAIGDVTNKIQLAHVASHQGTVAVKNIMGQEAVMDYSVIPGATFTTPEFATVGITEKEAKSKELDIEVGKFPFAANGKALIYGEKEGFVKIIKEKGTDKVIGGAIVGPHATDLIPEISLAIKNNLTVDQIVNTIHAHPTTAESIHEAALELEGGAIHFVK
ncbi:dihydrolipoyl dehydrogenase [Clostridium amazonitimonense]|uniref:dihydrolipoyl dehydrogenase n=1 Tax=Clostridium amazonitimonense TaxID=1499689 RepID=UPI000509AC3C|nr:dihydrolipoyl dehydrogenase [Clostridium amazonitimonense]